MGNYAFGVTLTGGTTLEPDPILVVVFAPETHGEQPPDSGEDTTGTGRHGDAGRHPGRHCRVHPHRERGPA